MLAAFRAEYVTATGRLVCETQTAMILALHLDLVEQKHRARIAAMLKANIEAHRTHLVTGFIGTPYACLTLSDNGMHELAGKLLLQEQNPSWLYEVNMGATTVWERWNSILPDGKISGTGMNSLNHYAYGAIVEWIYRSVCGLRLDEEKPAGLRVIFRPHPDERLGEAEASVRFAAGRYTGGWALSGSRVHYHFTVPFDGALRCEPDRPLRELKLNGEEILKERLAEDFTAGIYEIEAEIV